MDSSNTAHGVIDGAAYEALLQGAHRDATMAGEVIEAAPLSEAAVQAQWFEQAMNASMLITREGHRLEVVSPGWWNQHAGPDFRGAQIAFNGELFTGDVEVHLSPDGWKAHGHHLDRRYDEVILHVVLRAPEGVEAVQTTSGRSVPLLVLDEQATIDWEPGLDADEPMPEAAVGACSVLIPTQGTQPLTAALQLAAEWRLLTKAKALRERMDRAGNDQALYEAIMHAAGYSAFKHHFQMLARQLPYDRAVQLAHHDPMLLEAALLQLAGLLPDALPDDAGPVPHHARLLALRREHLPGMRALPMAWTRSGLRPANYPERRLAGVARVIARTSRDGLSHQLQSVWKQGGGEMKIRERFGDFFPAAMGFWSTRYTWTGKRLENPVAVIGASRIHGIIGNVFIPAGLALARQKRDRGLEERVMEFYLAYPKEGSNHVIERMLPKLLGESGAKLKLGFAMQQGMLQFYHDWCGPNPSCRNCTMHRYLDRAGQ